MEQRTSLLSSRRSTSISALVLDGKVPPLLLDNALIHLRNSGTMMDGNGDLRLALIFVQPTDHALLGSSTLLLPAIQRAHQPL
jgi:hypothetical protein